MFVSATEHVLHCEFGIGMTRPLASNMAEFQEGAVVCPCTEKQFPVLHSFAYARSVLKTLHSVKSILDEEECRSVGEAGVWWRDELAVVLAAKPLGVVHETLGVLEEYKGKWWYSIATERIQMLSELYQERLVTEDEVKRMKGEGGYLPDRVLIVQCTKPPEVVTRTADVLDKCGDSQSARQLRALNELFTRRLLTADECSEVARKELCWEKHLAEVLSTKPAEVVQEAIQVLKKHGYPVKKELKTLNELFTRHLLTAEECSEVARIGLWWEKHLAEVLSTKPVEVWQEAVEVLEKHDCCHVTKLKIPNELFTRHLLTAEECSEVARKWWRWEDHLAQVLSTKPVEVWQEATEVLEKHGCHVKNLKMLPGASTPSISHLVKRYQKMTIHPRDEAAEAALDDHCWIPFGVQSQSVGPEGGKLCLQPSAGAMGGEEGETILLEVPPGAICPSESVEIHSAVIPDGPFTLPEGYQLGSMVVYIHYDSRRVTQPLKLRLPHWYGGEDHIQDGLAFAKAPHTLKEGESVYHFELLEGGRFAEQWQCGVLQISGHCSLFAEVFKVKASSLYYASLWTHQVAGNVVASNEMHSKVVITYADQVWIEVLEEYWKDWERCKASNFAPVKFQFSDEKKVQGNLSSHCGEGWKASLIRAEQVCSDEVGYGRGKKNHKKLEYEVKQHIYPPAIDCVVMYDFPPDCSRGAMKTKLSIEGTKSRISFPIKVYEVKTPHPPSSPSASTSSFVETSSYHPVNEETDCQQLDGSRDAAAASQSPLTPPPDMVATTPQEDTTQPPFIVSVSDAATSITLPPLTPPAPDTADIIKALNHQLDAQWRLLGTFLRVDYQLMEAIRKGNGGNPADCMLDLLGKWTSNQAGTGTLPRTWQTVVDAVKETGFGAIAESLALKHGVNLSQ